METKIKTNLVTFSFRTARNLTEAIKLYSDRVRAGEFEWSTRQVPQKDGTYDTVYMYLKPKVGFVLEFTKKIAEESGNQYVNWARVSGPEVYKQEFIDLAYNLQKQDNSQLPF